MKKSRLNYGQCHGIKGAQGMKITIKKFSSHADEIFPQDNLRRLCSGYLFSEGPVWDIKTDTLYFTDFKNFQIWQWSEEGGARLYRENSNRAIGLSMDAAGRIVAAESKAHAVSFSDNEKSQIIADNFLGKRFNSPNDVVAAKDGYIFFTDPYSEMMGEAKELGFNGIFSISPHGELRLVDDAFEHPNGLAFSPDESLLYVNDTKKQQIFAFSVDKNKAAQKAGVFAHVNASYGKGVVDGMKVDSHGNVYVTGPGGIWVFSPNGSPLAVAYIPEWAGNLCFGGSDSRTLFITASASVYALDVGISGIVPFRN
jgi:gluconolactonase